MIYTVVRTVGSAHRILGSVHLCYEHAKEVKGICSIKHIARKYCITRDQEKNRRVVGIHCIFHREALASKSMQGHLDFVFVNAVTIVNFIKARALAQGYLLHYAMNGELNICNLYYCNISPVALPGQSLYSGADKVRPPGIN